MKRLFVYFSSQRGEEREQFIKSLTGVNSYIFSASLRSDLLIILLGNVSNINEDLLLRKFTRTGNLIVFVPDSIKDYITQICNKKGSFLQENHTSSIILTKSIEGELKRLLAKELKTSSEQITFNKVIEFDFVPEPPPHPPKPPEGGRIRTSLELFIKENQQGLPFDEVKTILRAIEKILAQNEKPSISIVPSNIFYDEKKKVVTMVDEQISTQEQNTYKSAEALDDMGDVDNNNVYSLACLTYELLSGKHPYYDENTKKVKNAKEVKITEPPIKPRQISSLNQRQWEILDKGLIPFKADGRVYTTSKFLENFLRKTLYDFIKQMVEAPFFVGLVMGEVFLIFTVGYLYFGSGGVSRLEYRQIREKIEQSPTSEKAESWIKRIASQNERTELEKLLKIRFPQQQTISSTLQKQLEEETKLHRSTKDAIARELNTLSNSFIEIAKDVSSGGVWGRITCNSEAAKLAISSIKKVVDIDSWLINQNLISEKTNRHDLEDTLKKLIELCKGDNDKKNELENYKNILDEKYSKK